MTDLQKAGEVIRPLVTQEQARELTKIYFNVDAVKIKEFFGYDDRNFYIKAKDEKEYVLKVANCLDTVNISILDRQNEIMTCLSEHEIAVQRPVPSTSGRLIEKHLFTTPCSSSGETADRLHVVRLLTFLPGDHFGDSSLQEDLLEDVARQVANVDVLLTRKMSDSIKECQPGLWSILSISKLRDFVEYVDGKDRQQIILDIVERFEKDIAGSGLSKFTAGCIHGDPNDNNILVNSNKFSGLLDWQDVGFQYYVFDLAMLIMYTSYRMAKRNPSKHPFDSVVGPLIRGFTAVCPLQPSELQSLPLLVASRYAQSLTLGEYSYRVLDPTNDYVLQTSDSWSTLQVLWKHDLSELASHWLRLSTI